MSLFLAFVFGTVAHAAISAANKHFSLFELSLRKCLLTDTCQFLTVFNDVIPPLLRCYFGTFYFFVNILTSQKMKI